MCQQAFLYVLSLFGNFRFVFNKNEFVESHLHLMIFPLNVRHRKILLECISALFSLSYTKTIQVADRIESYIQMLYMEVEFNYADREVYNQMRPIVLTSSVVSLYYKQLKRFFCNISLYTAMVAKL